MEAQLLGYLHILQGLTSLYYLAGIAGCLLPFLLSAPTLASATVYGRLLFFTPPQGVPAPAGPPTLLRSLVALALSCTVLKSTAFTAFYIVAVGASCAVLWLCALTGQPSSALLLSAAFSLHVGRRLLECLCVHTFSPDARMPLHLLAFGALHYVCAPLSLLALVQPCSGSGSGAGSGSPTTTTTLQQALGQVLFVSALAAQAHVHAVLSRLPRGPIPRRRYPLPTAQHSTLFALCLCPHYAAEIALYTGLLLWRQGSVAAAAGQCGGGAPPPLPAALPSALHPAATALAAAAPLLLLAWVACNLTVTAGRLKTWYVAAYPDKGVQGRAALCPWVY